MNYIIESKRKFQTWPSWHLVYEWEDVFQKEMLNCKIKCKPKFWDIINRRLIQKLKWFDSNLISNKDIHIIFEMSPRLRNNLMNRKNIYPFIIDFFLKKNELEEFENAYSKNKIVFISSKQVYDYLKDNNLHMNIKHLALSLPDKYKIIDNDLLKKKKYTCVLFGRVNKILKTYLIRYSENNPYVIYVFEGEKKFEYYTNKGEYVGYFKSRESYIDLMKQSKIALYSTPGMDNSRTDTNGFNQVTPKFLEYISCGCLLILRYPKNSDTDYFELNKFCPSVETYEDFEILMNKYLNTEPSLDFYAAYLSHHYTSVRVSKFKEILKDYE